MHYIDTFYFVKSMFFLFFFFQINAVLFTIHQRISEASYDSEVWSNDCHQTN